MIIETNQFANDFINTISLKLSDGGYAISGTEWQGSCVSPPFSRLYYIISGDPFIVRNSKKSYLKKGHIYLIPFGLSYEYGCDASVEQLYFHLNLVNINGYDVLSSLQNHIGSPISKEEGDRFVELYRSESVLDFLILKQTIYNYIVSILQIKSDVKLNNVIYSDCVKKAVSYIQENLSIQLSVSLVAQNTFVSASKLTKKFKMETGISIGKYIDSLILYRAEQALLKSEMSIMQISELLGFCDQFYFSRKFKENFGITPSEYRKRKM